MNSIRTAIRTACLGAILAPALLLGFGGCDRKPPAAPIVGADIEVRPGFKVYVEVTDRMHWSAAAISPTGTQPIAEGCLIPGTATVSFTQTEGADVRLRMTPVRMPDRGEEPIWTKLAPEACVELASAPIEAVYKGGEQSLVVRFIDGKLVLRPKEKPPG